VGAKPRTIKVCLTNGGKERETPWAEDLGPAPGGRKVRLVNVPFLHAKPTWGDVIVVRPDRNGTQTWDRGGLAWREVASHIAEDGGRWAMIVDYIPHLDTSGTEALRAIVRACGEHDVVCEGAWAPVRAKPGRAYLAVPYPSGADIVMRTLRAAVLPCELVQIHPAPELGRAARSASLTDSGASKRRRRGRPPRRRGRIPRPRRWSTRHK
jgi:hypothetical protein